MTERERYWWRPGSDAIDTVAEHHDGSLTSHHPKGHGPVELAESGATVNAVCPVGAADAGMGREVLELKVLATGRSADDISTAAARTNPLGRNASPADVASAIEFFLTMRLVPSPATRSMSTVAHTSGSCEEPESATDGQVDAGMHLTVGVVLTSTNLAR